MAVATLPSPTPPETEEPDEDEHDGGKMSFLEHLDELRKRILVSVVSLLAGFLIGYYFIDQIQRFIMQPLQAVLPPGGTMIYTEPTEGFMLQLKMAALAGALLAFPILLWEIWQFVAPGLYAHEKKIAIPFVVFSTFFFTLGALFSHFVVFPWAWLFFASFGTDYMQFTPKIQSAFTMYWKMALAMGAIFELPTVVMFLARIGLVTPSLMWKNFKYAVLMSFIIAAVLTPPDVVSQTLTAIPTIGLYLLSIGVAWVFQKRPNNEKT